MELHRLGPRVALRAFEAWDPAFDMLVIVNAGSRVQVRRVAFDLRRGGVMPPIRRGVEFDCGASVYFAEFDRFEENTAPSTPIGAETGHD